MKTARFVIAMALLIAPVILAPVPVSAQITVGENTKLNASALATFGYAGDYGNDIPSSHGLTFGLDGTVTGSYYNPNFLNFSATPYWNQSRNNSNYQSLTGASGINTTANLFTGSNYPGTVNYHYDTNSTGTFGLAGVPNFTEHGHGQGFSVGWSALLPDMPTLSVSYARGSGGGDVYGTDQQTHSSNQLINVHSNYSIEGFRLNGYYNHNNFDSSYPVFLTGQPETESKTASDNFGFGATHPLPLNGSFYANYDRTSSDTNFIDPAGSISNSNNYTYNTVNSGVSFHPTQKWGFFVNESYITNLSGYLSHSIDGSGAPPIVDVGSGSHSYTMGGGTSYQITDHLNSQVTATWYDQYYFGQSYTGTFIAGTVNYTKRLWDTFGLSGTVIESSNGQGTNALGFIANVNFGHNFGMWSTSGNFSYAQNVQTLLVTYTTSYYNYSANVRRRFPHHMNWTTAFNGSHTGLTQVAGDTSHAEGFSTSIGSRRFNLTGNYNQASGISAIGTGGQPLPPTPGISNYINFNGHSYGGGLSVSPVSRLTVSGAYARAFSDTLGAQIPSHNDSEIFNAQVQYHLRRIGFQAGYTRFRQSISAGGAPPADTSSYFVGISRWFDIF
jgi:hypothetical protein